MSGEFNESNDKEILLKALNIAFNIVNDIQENNNENIRDEVKILENNNIERCKGRILSVNKMLDNDSIKEVLLNNNELYKLVVDTSSKLDQLIRSHK